MKNIVYLLLFACLTNPLIAQVKPFRISASADVPSLLLVKKNDLVSSTTDTMDINGTIAKLNIHVSKPQTAIIETDQQQVVIWMIPGYSLDVKIENNQLIFGGQAALYADYFQNKQNNFINFCHFYYQRNPSFNEDSKGYMNFLDSVTVHQVRYFKNYFSKNRSLYVRQFMEEEAASINYENLSRKLLFGDYELEKFNAYQKAYGIKSAVYYPFSDKVSFTNAELLRIYFFQQFSGQFVADIALKQQKATGKDFSFPQYIDVAMQTIDKLTGGAKTTYPIKAIFISRVLEEMERKNKVEWTPVLDKLLQSLHSKSSHNSFLLLKEKLNAIISAQKT